VKSAAGNELAEFIIDVSKKQINAKTLFVTSVVLAAPA
jgi:hypothetical protein